MPERIIVLSDGTGNSSAKVWRTNVWRTFDFLNLSSQDQVAMYDDGVGTSSFLPLAILGGAFGWGLKRNVLDLYKFVCRNYTRNPDNPSKIYAFGFSRGAFTVRVLIALILHQGLTPYNTENDLSARARSAYRAFRAQRFHSISRIESIFRRLRDALFAIWDKMIGRKPYDKSENTNVTSIEFMGLWDTVAAYGLPIEEMTRGFSEWIWPLELPDRILPRAVKRACHALSLDDQRTTFHPVLWTEAREVPAQPDQQGRRWIKNERLSQVWFAGVHANVGGGYPDDSLAYIPLCWLMQEAKARGLVFKTDPPSDPDAFRSAASASDKDGRQYDSRAGLAGYYRYGPRKLNDLCHTGRTGRSRDAVEIPTPKIHESALMRLRSDTNAYAPIGLPADYAVVTAAGEILDGVNNPNETPKEAKIRAQEQEIVWNFVWLRRIVYFATLAASFHLAAFWLFHDQHPEREYQTALTLVSQTVRFIESFLPRQVVRWWTDYYATNPVAFSAGLLVLAVLIWIGSRLEGQIADRMRAIWKSQGSQLTITRSPTHSLIYIFRSSRPYQATLRTMRYYILPFLSAVTLIWLGLVGVNHLLWNVTDPMGVYCTPTPVSQLQELDAERPISKTISFQTNSPCFATGIKLTKNAKYEVTFEHLQKWKDGEYETTPAGYRIADRTGWHRISSFLLMPMRRDYFRRWYTVIARIGLIGAYEDFLDPSSEGTEYGGETGRLRADGELFLYVNDAVIGLPWVYGVFYADHQGSAEVKVRRVGK
jgi:uncharacterized protein (DUF2235 family)